MGRSNFIMPIGLFLFLFIVGCASTNLKVADNKSENAVENAQDGDDEKIDNIKISEFILGVGDTIDIAVYRHDDLKKSIKIGASGRIMFPLIGDVQAAGKDIFALRDEMQKSLAKYIVDPQVTIDVSTVTSQKIIVLGEVNNQGIFTLDTDISVTEAISKAGGMTDDAKLSNVVLIRKGKNKPKVLSLNLKKAFKEGDMSQNLSLQNGDIVYVPAIKIADVSRVFSHISQIISPFVNLESGVVLWPSVKSVMKGEDVTTSRLAIPATR